VIIHLGRPSARGEVQRVAGWRAVLVAGGWNVDEVSLAECTDWRPVSRIGGFVRGDAAIESATWSANCLRRRLAEIRPELIVVVSVRAWLPDLSLSRTPIVLDLVDRLSENYRQRAHVASGARRVALGALAHQHRRIEQRLGSLPPTVHLVCAGFGEGLSLGATWLPIFLTEMPAPVDLSRADHDAAFVGSLRYEPNIDALRLLAETWPQNRRLLVAGADPPDEVVRIARLHRWTLLPNFSCIEDILERSHMTIAPLRIGTGLQIKVLEAAARGVPQIVSSVAASGFEPGFVTATEPLQIVTEVVAALNDRSAVQQQASDSRSAVAERYLPSPLADRLAMLLEA
jgi:Glycosyl transferases group 1